MVTEDFEDGEGELLRRVRAVVGEQVPVVISLDYHTNLTPAMAELTDGIAVYYTYPHIDRDETGRRAARILETVLERGRPTVRVFRKLPFLLPLNFQCTMVEPSAGIVRKSAEGEGGDVLNLCYGAGFPPSDLAECGPGVIAHGYSEEEVEQAADYLNHYVLQLEPKFAEPLLTPDEAVTQAIGRVRRSLWSSRTPKTIPAVGGRVIPPACWRRWFETARKAGLCVLTDPQAAAAAHAAGEGAHIEIDLGGCTPLPDVKPFHGTFQVTKLSNGRFLCKGPCVGGREAALGPTALLTIGGVSIVVASKRMQAYDLEIFRHLGFEPTEQKILATSAPISSRSPNACWWLSRRAPTWSTHANYAIRSFAAACDSNRSDRRSTRSEYESKTTTRREQQGQIDGSFT